MKPFSLFGLLLLFSIFSRPGLALDEEKWVRIAGSGERFCWLDGEGLKCLGQPGAPVERYPQIREPFALYGGNGGLCIHGSDGLDCLWDGEKKPIPITPLKAADRISVSSKMVCGRTDGKFHCFRFESGKMTGELALPKWAASLAAELVAGIGYACLSFPDSSSGTVRWGCLDNSGWKELPMNYYPADSHDSVSHLTLRNHVLCGITGRNGDATVICRYLPKYGISESGINKQIPEGAETNHYGNFSDIVLTSSGHLCVLDAATEKKDSQAFCYALPTTRDEADTTCLEHGSSVCVLEKYQVLPAFRETVFLAPYRNGFCALDSGRIRCQDVSRQEPDNGIAELQPLTYFDFAPAVIPEALLRLSDQVYGPKQELLRRLAKRLATTPNKELALFLLRPALEGIESESVERNFLVLYRRWLAEQGIRGGKREAIDFGRTDENRRLALGILSDLTRSHASRLGAGAAHELAAGLLLEIEKLLASGLPPGEYRAFAKARARYEPLFAEWEKAPSTRSGGRLGRALLNYLWEARS